MLMIPGADTTYTVVGANVSVARVLTLQSATVVHDRDRRTVLVQCSTGGHVNFPCVNAVLLLLSEYCMHSVVAFRECTYNVRKEEVLYSTVRITVAAAAAAFQRSWPTFLCDTNERCPQ